jgi:hypothetical protein
MKTVSYTTVLRRAAELAGRAYEGDDGNVILQSETAAMLRGFIGVSVASAWTFAPWPETCPVERRQFAPAFVESLAYTVGDVVWDPLGEAYYQCIRGTATIAPTSMTAGAIVESTGYWVKQLDDYNCQEWDDSETYAIGDIVWHSRSQSFHAMHTVAPAGTPPTNTSFWSPIQVLERKVLFQADGATVIGDIYGLYGEDPRISEDCEELSYTQDDEGMTVLDRVNEVWIQFWTLPPSFTTAPATIPHRFADVAAFGAAGLMLRADGKTDSGNELVQMSRSILNDQLSRLATIT